MSNQIVFARPRFHYASYADLYRLIELAGYKMIYFDEIDPYTDDTYICTLYDNVNDPTDSAVWAKGWPDAKADIVLYDIEWHVGDNALPAVPGLARIWAADRWYAHEIGAEYVPLGSDKLLANMPFERGEYHYDVATLSYNAPPRRQKALDSMRQHGLTIAPNGWGMERYEALVHSKAMVHIHQLNHVRTVAPQRFAIAAAYKMPLITEDVADYGIFEDYVLKWIDPDIGGFVKHMLDNRYEAQREACGEALYELLCEQYSFKKVVEAAV